MVELDTISLLQFVPYTSPNERYCMLRVRQFVLKLM
jgi:hypothetical protein